MKRLLIIMCLMSINFFMYGQKKIKDENKIVFVIMEDRPNNMIMIPNLGKLHTFKIYKKETDKNDFELVATKRKPRLPMRYNITPYAVSWEDKGTHSRNINYKVVAFNKKGVELCEMKIVWQDKK